VCACEICSFSAASGTASSERWSLVAKLAKALGRFVSPVLIHLHLSRKAGRSSTSTLHHRRRNYKGECAVTFHRTTCDLKLQ
jgi:hypothetical protein